MDATAEENPKVNSEVELADSLRGWAADLADAAKAYKGASGQDGLLLRSKISASAKQIINAIKEPGETCFEYSVQVRYPSKLFLSCLLIACRWRKWAHSVCSWSSKSLTKFLSRGAYPTGT
jgi:hypothetical protein